MLRHCFNPPLLLGLPKPQTAKEIKLSEISAVQFLVDSFIARNSITILTGAPGEGKTWVALALAKSILLGENFLGHFKANKGKIVYFDQENPKEVLKERLNFLDIPDECEFYHFSNLDLENDFETIKNSVMDKDIVIFDSLVHFHHRNEDKATGINVVLTLTS